MVGTTGANLSRLPVIALAMGAAALSAPALWIGGRLMGRAIRQRRPDLLLFAIAAVATAFGAVAATLYAGTGLRTASNW